MSYLEGHHQRLRDRFNGSGLGAFEDHEVLELLLTYAIPRKDVKPIARGLLDRFGSLSNVLHEGSIASAPVYPRLVVEAEPSEEDVAITRTLVSVFEPLGVPVVDHIIVAGPPAFSMAEAGLLRGGAA